MEHLICAMILVHAVRMKVENGTDESAKVPTQKNSEYPSPCLDQELNSHHRILQIIQSSTSANQPWTPLSDVLIIIIMSTHGHQPWCNPLWLTGHKAPTDSLTHHDEYIRQRGSWQRGISAYHPWNSLSDILKCDKSSQSLCKEHFIARYFV